MDSPTGIGKYLGCTNHYRRYPHRHCAKHQRVEIRHAEQGPCGPWTFHYDKPPSSVPAVACDMHGFVGQRVERYCELGQISLSMLRPAATLSIDADILSDQTFSTRGQLSISASKI
jgi:hypothetical protein